MTSIYSRIEHARTADAVVRQIEGLILQGVLRDGDRLPGERELAAEMNVSRPILRDALKALEARGLLVSRQGGGTHVANIVGEVFAPPMRELIATHPKATADYLEYRREVEAVAAEMAARRATPADKALLADIVARMEHAHAAADFDAEAEIDVEFHNAVGECAHNFVLLHTLRSCYRLLADGVFVSRARIYDLPGAREELLAQHRAIFHAIRDGDPAAARAAAVAHIAYMEKKSAEAERTGEWERIATLRLRQRAGQRKPNRRPAAAGS
ncbi:FadR/GntR family transcriptional regulator [Chelativorans intermedius]|uniref:Pyruvate dehydrogenase complex repressor n=1 Tax=Chelativorans intermedius TaxID=515947 RepID=A0ABV6D7V1_9HYPH|nr:FadR/GntR family transcriptional regulator [Chelativorans intermedius]MCT8999849.1 FadR family transcriptional regulator [Chelativorans intermedius]